MRRPPLPTGDNGRGAGGKFAAGNAFARGNPNNRRAQELRNLLVASVTPEDIAKALATIRGVMDAGKPNERLAAAESLLDRVLGRPVPSDQAERLERLEEAVGRLAARPGGEVGEDDADDGGMRAAG